MAIQVDSQAVKLMLNKEGADYGQLTENPGFSHYWRTEGVEPRDAAAAVLGEEVSFAGYNRLASDMASFSAQPFNVPQGLGRVSGASLQQNLARHLPAGLEARGDVYFIPGGQRPLTVANGKLIINVFALDVRGTKLYLGEFHLLSVLAHYLHRMATGQFSLLVQGMPDMMTKMMYVGAATLFFTSPTSGPVRNQWDEAEKKTAEHFALLRKALVGGGDPGQLESLLGLPAPAGLAAPYPLATYMCKVIDGAFGRARLVSMLHGGNFASVYEDARVKYALSPQYSLTGGSR